jgi:hypothetical protein
MTDADRLAREAIKAVAGLHTMNKMAARRNWHCRHCLTMWPCPTFHFIEEAWTAIRAEEGEVTTDGTLT